MNLSLSDGFCVVFFSFTALFSIFSFLVFVLRRKPWCGCHVCRSFLSSAWTRDHDNLCDWYTRLLRDSPTGTVHVHVLNNVITSNPDNVEHVLSTRFHNYPKGQPFSAILGDLLGRGIFAADGASWQFQRKIASLELGSVSIRAYALEIFGSETRHRLVPVMAAAAAAGAGPAVDLQDVFRRFSFDNICRFSFGVDPGCLGVGAPASVLAEAFDVASRISAERALAPSPAVWRVKRFFNLGSERRLRGAIRVVTDLAGEIIAHRRKTGFSAGNDLLSRFMCSVTDDRYLRDIVVSFLLAGRDTVASALTSLFYFLAQNPDCVSEIRAEMGRVMGPAHDDVASFPQLREMHYLHACLYETMRLYPPVQFDSKFCQEDDVLPDGTFVQRGARMTYHPYAMGRMERIWGPDCLEFNPRRWLRDGVYSPESPFKYPVFQAGPRVCMGKEMAIVQMKCAAVAIVKNFDIEFPGSADPPKFVPGLTASVRGGLPVLVRPRGGDRA